MTAQEAKRNVAEYKLRQEVDIDEMKLKMVHNMIRRASKIGENSVRIIGPLDLPIIKALEADGFGVHQMGRDVVEYVIIEWV